MLIIVLAAYLDFAVHSDLDHLQQAGFVVHLLEDTEGHFDHMHSEALSWWPQE